MKLYFHFVYVERSCLNSTPAILFQNSYALLFAQTQSHMPHPFHTNGTNALDWSAANALL